MLLSRKHKRVLLYALLTGLGCIVIRRSSRSPSRHPQTPSSPILSQRQPRKLYSSIDCGEEPAEHSCSISNLYVLNQSLHVFLDTRDTARPPVNLTWLYSDVSMFTGIGFGSFYVRPWNNQTFGSWTYAVPMTPSYALEKGPTDTKSQAEPTPSHFLPGYQKNKVIPLFVRFDEPPDRSSLRYYPYPVMLFSILWSNLFRTLYAGMHKLVFFFGMRLLAICTPI